MKGLKEILLSFSLALITILALAQIRKIKQRSQPVTEPIASAGPMETTKISLNWGLKSIRAPEAWKHLRGSRNVVVAVIDTGCDVHHPALKESIWRNAGESGRDSRGRNKATNGIDDDANGFVDDFHGWNFSTNNNNLSDEHGHGTHIAGIIGARKLDGLGSGANSVRGVAPNVSLMILKYFEPETDGAENLRHTIDAIQYAVEMGADIINYSGGGVIKSAEEEAALRWASDQGVLVVAAAGNEGLNSDFFHFYPADYNLPNILSVGAVDQKEELMRMSNFGINTVDLAAPGKNIYSTLPNGQYGYMSGTSQATAFATGVAALLIASDQRFHNPSRLIDHLMAHTSKHPEFKGKLRSMGLLDAQAVFEGFDLKVSDSNP